MTQQVVIPPAPTTGDAPTLTLCACTLLASIYPIHLTPDDRSALAQQTVNDVMVLWNEIQNRIATGVLVLPLG